MLAYSPSARRPKGSSIACPEVRRVICWPPARRPRAWRNSRAGSSTASGAILQPAGIPLLALKGVAYLLRGMPHATTRLLSDIDVMVPRDRLDAAERLLLDAGWQSTTTDPYDQHYYRTWSHELPPLLFPGRLLAVDVHHTICPPVSRLRPDPQRFWADAVAIDDGACKVLSPVDSVLHAAVHLFFDSDFDGRFRDLVDLARDAASVRGRRRDVGSRSSRARARRGSAGRSTTRWRRCAACSRRRCRQPCCARSRRSRRRAQLARWMDRTLATVLTPIDPEPWPPAHRGLLWLLYVRSHWLRMPAHLLVPHLVRKSLRPRVVEEG